MKIQIDTHLCNGYGNCIAAAPDVFDLDDENIVVLLRPVEPGDRESLIEAIADCPVRALALVDDDE
jgi:ferredoxin